MSIAEEIAKKHQANTYSTYHDQEKTQLEIEETKEQATAKHKPWFKILDTQVDPDNINYGFFDFDWNDNFIDILMDNGYTGESQEEIVEKWFNAIIREMLDGSGFEQNVNAGNVVNFLKSDSGIPDDQ